MTSWSQFQTLLDETTAVNLRCHYNDPAHLAWHDKKKYIQEITQWKWIYKRIPEITQSVESAIFSPRGER